MYRSIILGLLALPAIAHADRRFEASFRPSTGVAGLGPEEKVEGSNFGAGFSIGAVMHPSQLTILRADAAIDYVSGVAVVGGSVGAGLRIPAGRGDVHAVAFAGPSIGLVVDPNVLGLGYHTGFRIGASHFDGSTGFSVGVGGRVVLLHGSPDVFVAQAMLDLAILWR